MVERLDTIMTAACHQDNGRAALGFSEDYVHAGITDCVILWNTADLGYLTVQVAHDLKRNRLRPGDPNIRAGRMLVPELVRPLTSAELAEICLEWLDAPERRRQLSGELRRAMGAPGAARAFVELVAETLETPIHLPSARR